MHTVLGEGSLISFFLLPVQLYQIHRLNLKDNNQPVRRERINSGILNVGTSNNIPTKWCLRLGMGKTQWKVSFTGERCGWVIALFIIVYFRISEIQSMEIRLFSSSLCESYMKDKKFNQELSISNSFPNVDLREVFSHK